MKDTKVESLRIALSELTEKIFQTEFVHRYELLDLATSRMYQEIAQFLVDCFLKTHPERSDDLFKTFFEYVESMLPACDGKNILNDKMKPH